MNHFSYQDGQLFAEQVPAGAIARTHGTPCYVYSRAAIESSFLAYESALAKRPHLVCYAVKANSNIAVLQTLARRGAGFDIVSAGELQRVLAAGGDPARVIFSGVGKSAAEIEMALRTGILCFNVESEPELERINRIAGELGLRAPISLRVNPDVDAGTHPYISTGLKENKFGIDSNAAPRVYRAAAQMPNIAVTGIDCHIGSQLTDTAPYLDALDKLIGIIDDLAATGIPIRHLDLGGGLGVAYRNESPPAPDVLVGKVLERLGDRPLTLLLEPGRSIVANAGILLVKVEYVKKTPHKNFVVVDGAMNDLLRPSLYGAWQDIIPVRQGGSGATLDCDVVGPVCESGDFLGKDRQLAASEGDLLAIRSAGAYGFAMSSNYNSRNRAAEVMVDGPAMHLIRDRERLDQQLVLEHLLAK